MSKTLWAPWRMDYILGPREPGCIFCQALADGEDSHEKNLVLHVGKHAFVMFNRFPYSHAHVMILPHRHVSDPGDLEIEERRELFDLVVESELALKQAFNPEGLNVGINIGEAAGAGIKDHLHVHIVPRWKGDMNFMPVLADTRTMPEHLGETYRKLRPIFDRLGATE